MDNAQAEDANGADDGGRVINRQEFAMDLLKKVAATPNVSLHFEASVSSIDFERQSASITSKSASQHDLMDESNQLAKAPGNAVRIPMQLHFDLLVGADGTASQVSI